MAVDVHALVQDTHDIEEALGCHPIKQHVRPGCQLAIARADLVAGPPDPGFAAALDSALKFSQVLLSLIQAPVLVRVVPDLFQICLRSGERTYALTGLAAFSARLPSRKASKSNGVEVPLRSPATSASRSARS